MYPFQFFSNFRCLQIITWKECISNRRSHRFNISILRIIRKIKADRNACRFNFGQLPFRKAIISRMHHIKLANILQIKTIQRITHIAANAALITFQKHPISVNNSVFWTTIFPNDLDTLYKFNLLRLQRPNDMFCLPVASEDTHVCAPLRSEPLRIHCKIYGISARIHDF